MGYSTYPCENCGGDQCPWGGHNEEIEDEETGQMKEVWVPCSGSNSCFEEACVLVPVSVVNGSMVGISKKPRKATYDGYGRFEFEEAIPGFEVAIPFFYEVHPHRYEGQKVILCKVWCASCFDADAYEASESESEKEESDEEM
jgi:hypothetical protein